MVKRFILILLIATAVAGLTGATEYSVTSAIKQVTVYKDRALVEREAKVSLGRGENKLIFDSLPDAVDARSLQVKGGQGAVLQDIELKTVYFNAIPDAKIQSLQEELEKITDRKVDLSDAIRRAREEKTFLDKITVTVTTVSPEQPVDVNPEGWMKMLDFYSHKNESLDQDIRKLEREQRTLESAAGRISHELNSIQQGRSKMKKQAIVTLQSEQSLDTVLRLSYLVYGPSWMPDYAIRVDSGRQQAVLHYNGVISQNSGEDWEGVRLILSTASPHVSATHPELSPWSLSFLKNHSAAIIRQREEKAEPMAQMYNMMETGELLNEEGITNTEYAPVEIHNATAASGATAVRFQVAGTHSIVSDNNQHTVAILTRSFPAAFRYSTVPKLAPAAYLKAKIKNDTEYPLLAGPTRVFLDGDFVANSQLASIAPGEEFWTFLGSDERLEVEYRQLSRDLFKGNIFETKDGIIYHYRTTLINHKNTEAEIVLWDQLPLPVDNKIKVKLLTPEYKEDSADLKKNDQGYLEWLLTLKPGETREIEFKFSIEYPKGEQLAGL